MFLRPWRGTPPLALALAAAPGADLSVMFAFFSNRLGCAGSILVSVLGTLLLLAILRGCGAG